jgi:succinate dehydrogenase / fumarate reductase, cytochrome b subunit
MGLAMQSQITSFSRLISTTVGRKFLMAASGAALVGFVIAHLIGNLQIFLGPEAINRYGHFLQTTPEILWPLRIGLLAMVLLHIVTSIQLTIESRAARPIAYGDKTYIKASLASRTMMISGLLIFSFIVYHLLHFTLLKVHPQYSQAFDAQGRHDVYSMMVRSFQQPSISIAYVVMMFCVCFHLSHGISSMFQSLGFNTLRTRPGLSCAGAVLAWLIFAGYCLMPAACLLGWVKLPPGVAP